MLVRCTNENMKTVLWVFFFLHKRMRTSSKNTKKFCKLVTVLSCPGNTQSALMLQFYRNSSTVPLPKRNTRWTSPGFKIRTMLTYPFILRSVHSIGDFPYPRDPLALLTWIREGLLYTQYGNIFLVINIHNKTKILLGKNTKKI